MVLGTVQYMSPEQARGLPVDARTDIWSLGAVLYEMLAGRAAFEGSTTSDIMVAVLEREPAPLDALTLGVRAELQAVVTCALCKQCEGRFRSMQDLAAELKNLQQAVEQGPSEETFFVAPALPEVRSEGQGRHWRISRRTIVLALVLILTGAGGLAAWRYGRSVGSAAEAEITSPVESATARGDLAVQQSLAVLPLVNVSGDTAMEYFADGMTDELTSALGKVPGLRVAARSSAFTFKDKPIDVQEVGAKLRVGSVLEGTVRRAGPRLRVTAQLVSTADGLALWSDPYQRELKDVFAVQEDIATAITRALRPTLGGQARAEVRIHTPTNVEAHDLYLKGRFFINKGTEADLRRSLVLFEQALAEDSTYALAHAGIADAWVGLADDYVPPREAFPRARAAALRAIALDSMLAEARASLGLVLRFHDWNFAAGERELRRAMALNPNAATTYTYRGLALHQGTVSQLDSALLMMRKAASLDPLNAQALADVCGVLVLIGRYEEAIAECTKALELDPQSSWALGHLGEALILAGQPADALAVLSRAENPPDRVRAVKGRALVALGRYDEARALLRNMERDAQRRYERPEMIAAVYAALGDRDTAFRWLEMAVQARSSNVSMIRVERHWDPIRGDPRFSALVRRMGLP